MNEMTIQDNVYALAMEMLNSSTTACRLDNSGKHTAVVAAIEKGKTLAKHMHQCYEGKTAAEIAALEGAELLFKAEARRQDVIVHSMYYPKHRRIEINSEAVQWLKDWIQKHALEKDLAPADVEPMFIAHELFHHLEEKHCDRLSEKFRVSTFSIGPIHMETPIRIVSEIGAHSFAMNLIGLSHFPYLYDKWEMANLKTTNE